MDPSSMLVSRAEMYIRWPCRIVTPVNHGEYAEGTDRQTDGRQTVTLYFSASVTTSRTHASERRLTSVV